jgi:hypothetical protein
MQHHYERLWDRDPRLANRDDRGSACYTRAKPLDYVGEDAYRPPTLYQIVDDEY